MSNEIKGLLLALFTIAAFYGGVLTGQRSFQNQVPQQVSCCGSKCECRNCSCCPACPGSRLEKKGN